MRRLILLCSFLAGTGETLREIRGKRERCMLDFLSSVHNPSDEQVQDDRQCDGQAFRYAYRSGGLCLEIVRAIRSCLCSRTFADIEKAEAPEQLFLYKSLRPPAATAGTSIDPAGDGNISVHPLPHGNAGFGYGCTGEGGVRGNGSFYNVLQC